MIFFSTSLHVFFVFLDGCGFRDGYDGYTGGYTDGYGSGYSGGNGVGFVGLDIGDVGYDDTVGGAVGLTGVGSDDAVVDMVWLMLVDGSGLDAVGNVADDGLDVGDVVLDTGGD